MKEAEAVTFAGATLDRAAQLRGDAAALAALAADPDARCLAVWRGRPLVDGRDGLALGWLPTGHPIFAGEAGAAIFLGRLGGAPRFARDLAAWGGASALAEAAPGFLDDSRTLHPDLPDHLAFADLRAVMSQLGPEDAGVAAAAKGVFAWHASHGFCARCGAASEVADAGWKRICPACGALHFPRTDPVVIMLITEGDSVLLGRSPAWPPGMYSLLAGFMEPGELIEAAVRREIWEEAGVRVGAVEYLSSQPWPFPSSLMIGCRGLALTREIVRDPVELEDARWLSREAVLDGLTGRDPEIRPARKGSIARLRLLLQAAYLNPAGGPSLAVVGWAGILIPMQAGPTGSGVRYIAFDEQASYRWHTKGDEGTLLFLAADHTAQEEVVLGDCNRVAP